MGVSLLGETANLLVSKIPKMSHITTGFHHSWSSHADLMSRFTLKALSCVEDFIILLL